MIGTIVAEGRATLRELKEYYSVEEAYQLYETIIIPRLNDYYRAQAQKMRR